MRSSSRLVTASSAFQDLLLVDPGALGGGRLLGGVEQRAEQPHQAAREPRIVGERLLHIDLAEGDAGLAQIFGIGAQDADLAPVEIGPAARAG